MIFSPDDRFVYVGGGGGGAIFARYETTTGRYEHDYSTGQSAMTSIVLSRDGRTIAGQSLSEHQVLFHDTDSEKIVHRAALSGWHVKPAPDGRSVLATGAGEGWHVEPFEVDRGPP